MKINDPVKPISQKKNLKFNRQQFKQVAKNKAKRMKILNKYNVNAEKREAVAKAFSKGDVNLAVQELKAQGLLTDKEIRRIQRSTNYRDLIKNPEVAKQALASLGVVLFSKNIFDQEPDDSDQTED